jgi:hypothetical protein
MKTILAAFGVALSVISIKAIMMTMKLPKFDRIMVLGAALKMGCRGHDGEINACRFSARTGGPGCRRRVDEGCSGNPRLVGRRDNATEAR